MNTDEESGWPAKHANGRETGKQDGTTETPTFATATAGRQESAEKSEDRLGGQEARRSRKTMIDRHAIVHVIVHAIDSAT